MYRVQSWGGSFKRLAMEGVMASVGAKVAVVKREFDETLAVRSEMSLLD